MSDCRRTALTLCAVVLVAAPTLAGAEMLHTAKGENYGSYLTDGNGRALYLFEADKRGSSASRAQSACYDACAKAWPPLIAEQPTQVGNGVDKSLVGTAARKDGQQQVTYNGWPLYYFVKDAGAGQATGQDVKGFGAEWYLITPQGTKVHDK